MNIIIGGTHGLGKDTAAILRDRGETAFVTGRSYSQADHGEGMAVDLTQKDQADKLVDYIKGLEDTEINGFYWVAGFGYNGEFALQEDVLDLCTANFSNVMPIAHAAWKKMIAQPHPSNFVIVSSTTGVRARKNEAAYAATKHAQVGFGRSLGMESEWLATPVKVALFEPGGMKSPFWDKKRPSGYDDFMDTAKVAERIIERVDGQEDYFYEELIERGSV